MKYWMILSLEDVWEKRTVPTKSKLDYMMDYKIWDNITQWVVMAIVTHLLMNIWSTELWRNEGKNSEAIQVMKKEIVVEFGSRRLYSKMKKAGNHNFFLLFHPVGGIPAVLTFLYLGKSNAEPFQESLIVNLI